MPILPTSIPEINLARTILTSASRTATIDSPDITNFNAKGAHFIIDVSAIGTAPFIVVSIQGKDPISGNYYDILVGTTINVVDTFILKVYPGIPDVITLSTSDVLPNTFRVRVVHGNADPITYSISTLFVV